MWRHGWTIRTSGGKRPRRPSGDVGAKSDAFRGAFKRAKDGLVELGLIEIEDERVVRLTEKGRNAMHVTAS